MGAYGLAVVAAFAVAMALLVPSQTVSAEQPGDTATVGPFRVTDPANDDTGRALFTIDARSTATGSFSATSAVLATTCQDNASCDVKHDDDDDAATPPVDVPDSIVVNVYIAKDSAPGFILVKATDINGTATTDQQFVIDVVKADPDPARITISASPKAISSKPGDPAVLTVTVYNDKGEGIPGHKVDLIATNGRLSLIEDANGDATSEPQTVGTPDGGDSNCSVSLGCHVTTRTAEEAVTGGNETVEATDRPAVKVGTAQVTLDGGGRGGTATITAITQNGVTASTTVVLYGDAKNITAVADESSLVGKGLDVYRRDSHRPRWQSRARSYRHFSDHRLGCPGRTVGECDPSRHSRQ